MGDPLQSLSDADLRTLSVALAGGRLEPPYTAAWLGRFIDAGAAVSVAARLTELAEAGMQPGHVSVVADAILAARAGRPAAEDVVDLVWTGPEAAGAANRDTGVVVRELFAQATESIHVAGFAVFQGRSLFLPLAKRMAALPSLRARLYLDVHRGHSDTSSDAELVVRFAHKFVAHDWPQGFPLPVVYYDPRSLSSDSSARASLHAKCVVADRRVALVTSANFTEAAQERNIEAGVVVRSERFASRLADHFDALAEKGVLRRLDLRVTI
jgi:phosphatidylserine/phosphatidylglycerophosphate/cardiolipin synthase-like enzyme